MKSILLYLLIASSLTTKSQTNSFKYGQGLDNLPVIFYCSSSTIWKFEDVTSVKIGGDTSQNLKQLTDKFNISNLDYFFLLDIRDIITTNGFTKTSVYKDALKEYNDFHDLHQPLYTINGSMSNKIINTYKNYVIRSTEVKYLIKTIEAMNDHYNIKTKYQKQYTGYIEAYNNYHQGK